MDRRIIDAILQSKKKAGTPFEVTITGVSMNPALYENDVVTVKAQNDYGIGDILVFNYKSGELLIHRLLEKKNDRYFCKGDNSFRLEDVTIHNIIGKAIEIKRSSLTLPIENCSPRLIILSLAVNRAFFKCRYDVEKTKQTEIYKLYERIILKEEKNIMVYKKNNAMEYTEVNEDSLVIFDPETEDTHIFDGTGVAILNALNEPCDITLLLDKLCSIYTSKPEDIRADVENFIELMVEKKVVEII